MSRHERLGEMDRRGFLKRMLGVVAFVIAIEVGLGAVAPEIVAEPAEITVPQGLPYLISNSGAYFKRSLCDQ